MSNHQENMNERCSCGHLLGKHHYKNDSCLELGCGCKKFKSKPAALPPVTCKQCEAEDRNPGWVIPAEVHTCSVSQRLRASVPPTREWDPETNEQDAVDLRAIEAIIARVLRHRTPDMTDSNIAAWAATEVLEEYAVNERDGPDAVKSAHDRAKADPSVENLQALHDAMQRAMISGLRDGPPGGHPHAPGCQSRADEGGGYCTCGLDERPLRDRVP